MSGRLQDKVALVSGAGCVADGWGNGKAVSVLFAREGAKVFAADINLAAAEETKKIIEDEGGSCIAYQADVMDSAQVEGMVAACAEAFGRIDVLHNNVGGSAPGGAVEMSEELWDRQINYNLKTVFLTCKHAVPQMLTQGGGAIVNVASVAGIRYGDRPLIGYQASKAGLIQFSRALAIQHAKDGIRSNCVLPGLMNTPLVTHRVAVDYNEGKVAETIAARDALCPTGKMGDAWDVAYAALYLASDQAKYVTATEIIVDGGLTAQCG